MDFNRNRLLTIFQLPISKSFQLSFLNASITGFTDKWGKIHNQVGDEWLASRKITIIILLYNVWKCCKITIILSAFVYANILKRTFEVFSITWNSKKLPNSIPKEAPIDSDIEHCIALKCQELKAMMSPTLASHLNRYCGNKWIELKRLYIFF